MEGRRLALLGALALSVALASPALAGASASSAPTASARPTAPAKPPRVIGPGPDFLRWLHDGAAPAQPAIVVDLARALGVAVAPQGAAPPGATQGSEGSFHVGPDGMKIDFLVAKRLPADEAPAALARLAAVARDHRLSERDGAWQSDRGLPGSGTSRVAVETVVLQETGDVALRVRYTWSQSDVAPPTVEDVTVRWKGLGDAAALPTFLRERLRPLHAVECDGLPGACAYWTFIVGGDADPTDLGRAIAAAAAVRGFDYDDAQADPKSGSVTGFQDCSGAVLTTRVWEGRLLVTLQMTGTSPARGTVAKCSEAPAAPPK